MNDDTNKSRTGAMDIIGSSDAADRDALSTTTGALTQLPSDPVKRDDLIIFMRKSSIVLACSALFLLVFGSFWSVEFGRTPWPPDPAMTEGILTFVASVFGANWIGEFLPTKEEIRKGLLVVLSRWRKK